MTWITADWLYGKILCTVTLQVMPSRTLTLPSVRSHLKSCHRVSPHDKDKSKPFVHDAQRLRYNSSNAHNKLCYTGFGLTNILQYIILIFEEFYTNWYRYRKTAALSTETLAIFMVLISVLTNRWTHRAAVFWNMMNPYISAKRSELNCC
jgi:hypothetical protein